MVSVTRESVAYLNAARELRDEMRSLRLSPEEAAHSSLEKVLRDSGHFKESTISCIPMFSVDMDEIERAP
jgi:hypothetical protein